MYGCREKGNDAISSGNTKEKETQKIDKNKVNVCFS